MSLFHWTSHDQLGCLRFGHPHDRLRRETLPLPRSGATGSAADSFKLQASGYSVTYAPPVRDTVVMEWTRDRLVAALTSDAPADAACREALRAGAKFLPPPNDH